MCARHTVPIAYSSWRVGGGEGPSHPHSALGLRGRGYPPHLVCVCAVLWFFFVCAVVWCCGVSVCGVVVFLCAVLWCFCVWRRLLLKTSAAEYMQAEETHQAERNTFFLYVGSTSFKPGQFVSCMCARHTVPIAHGV